MLALILMTRNSRFLVNSHSTNIDYGIYCGHILHFHIHYFHFSWPFEIGIIIPLYIE